MRSLSTAGVSSNDRIVFYARLHEEVKAIVEGEQDWIANTSNCAAILFHSLMNIS
jgi:putative methionine-R-sulfoxide reductase with GAF domain